MQRFYGLDIDQIGRRIRPRRAADLAANLPAEAQTWKRLDPALAWTDRDHLLAQIADNTGFLAWTKTPDAAKPGARFHHIIPRPGQPSQNDQIGRTEKTGAAADSRQLHRLLGHPDTL